MSDGPKNSGEIHIPWLEEFEAKHGKVKRRALKPKPPKPKEFSATEAFASAWAAKGYKAPVRELEFHPTRGWRFDFAWPFARVALEIEGIKPDGQSRHQNFLGYAEDCEKYNEAVLLGWRVLRVVSFKKKEVAKWVEMVRTAIVDTSVCVPISGR